MRNGVWFSLLLVSVFSGSALAAEIRVKVLDPQSAAVAGAQVSLVGADGGVILASQTTSAARHGNFAHRFRRTSEDQRPRSRLRGRNRRRSGLNPNSRLTSALPADRKR